MTKTKAKFHSAAFEQLECQKKGEISTDQQVFPMQFIFSFVTTDVTVRRQRFGEEEKPISRVNICVPEHSLSTCPSRKKIDFKLIKFHGWARWRASDSFD
jgi:hypothetical protein